MDNHLSTESTSSGCPFYCHQSVARLHWLTNTS